MAEEKTVQDFEEMANFLLPLYELRNASSELLKKYVELSSSMFGGEKTPISYNPNNDEVVKRVQRAIISFNEVKI